MGSRTRAIKPALTALVVLVLFILAFVAFILAPLLLTVVVAAAMWGYERWQKSRRQSGVRTLSVPRSLNSDAGTSREPTAEQAYGFGSGLGRDL
jgi:4-hydroxybenzoate polyprenyltransferase